MANYSVLRNYYFRTVQNSVDLNIGTISKDSSYFFLAKRKFNLSFTFIHRFLLLLNSIPEIWFRKWTPSPES